MTVYYILIVLIVLAGLVQRNKVYGNKETLIMFLAMFIVLAFRKAEKVGVDSVAGYYISFINIESMEVLSLRHNVGFYSLMRLISKLTGHNYQIYIVIISGFIMYSFYRLVRKYSINPLISVMWFIGMLFYTFMFSGLKQGIAMAILTYAFDFLIEDRKILFSCTVVLAASMHFPALAFFLALPVSKTKTNRNYLLFLSLLLVFVYLFRGRLLALMQFMYYGTESQGSTDARFFGTKVIMMLLIAFFAVIRRHSETDKLYTTLLYCMGIAIVFQTFCFYNNTFERLADYFFQFSILMLPLMQYGIDEYGEYCADEITPIFTIVVSVFSIWRFLSYVALPYSGLTPYFFFWQ